MLNTSVTDTVHNTKQQLTAMIASTTQDNDGVVRPDLAPEFLGERGECEQVGSGGVEVLGDGG
jgi:hypothetical protein